MKTMGADAWAKRTGPVKWPELSDGTLRLRPAHPDDAAAWHAIRAAAGPWQSPIQSVAAARALLEAMAAELPFTPGWRQFILEEGSTAQGRAIVGDIGLNWPMEGDHAEIGFELAPAARGRGLARRAVALLAQWVLDCTSLRGLVAITGRSNRPARATLEAAGLLPSSDPHLMTRFRVAGTERLYVKARSAHA